MRICGKLYKFVPKIITSDMINKIWLDTKLAQLTHHPEDEIVKNVLRNSTIGKRSKGAVFTLIAAKTCVIGCCIHLNIICQVILWNEKTKIKISLFLIPGNNSVFKFEKQSWSSELCGLYSTIWFLCMKTAVWKVFALVRQFLHFCKFTFCNYGAK